MKFLRQMYKTELRDETILDAENLEAGGDSERRFRGVAGDKKRKGELFGLANLLRFKDGTFRQYRSSLGSSSKRYGCGVYRSEDLRASVIDLSERDFEAIGGDDSPLGIVVTEMAWSEKEIPEAEESITAIHRDSVVQRSAGDSPRTGDIDAPEVKDSDESDHDIGGETQANLALLDRVKETRDTSDSAHSQLEPLPAGGSDSEQGDEPEDDYDMGGETQIKLRIFEQGHAVHGDPRLKSIREGEKNREDTGQHVDESRADESHTDVDADANSDARRTGDHFEDDADHYSVSSNRSECIPGVRPNSTDDSNPVRGSGITSTRESPRADDAPSARSAKERPDMPPPVASSSSADADDHGERKKGSGSGKKRARTMKTGEYSFVIGGVDVGNVKSGKTQSSFADDFVVRFYSRPIDARGEFHCRLCFATAE